MLCTFPVFSKYRRLFNYLKPELFKLSFAYVCMLILALSTAFYAFLAGPALNYVFTGDIAKLIPRNFLEKNPHTVKILANLLPESLLNYLQHLAHDPHLPNGTLNPLSFYLIPALIVLTAIIKGLAQVGQFFSLGCISQKILLKLRTEGFAALLRQPPSFFDKRSHGDLVSRLTHDTALIEQAFFYGGGPLLRDTLALIVLVIFCFLIDAQLALITIFLAPLSALPLSKFAKWLKRVSTHGQQEQGHINSLCYETLAGVRVVQSFGTENLEIAKLTEVGHRYYRGMLSSYFIRAIRTPTMEILGEIALAILLGLLGYHVQKSGLDAAHYISFFVAIILMYDPLKKLGNVSDYLATGAAGFERLQEILNLTPQIQDKPGARTLKRFHDQVIFKNVHFNYQPNIPVLRDINLTLPFGKVIALVGASGSGKTTLANLLPRFYEISSGGIYIDDQELREVTLASLRQQIAIVAQDTFLFNMSIKDNIAYGHNNTIQPLKMATIVEAAKAAYAAEFIERLPQGYDTIIGERGVTLSGGQRQRLAIARALIQNRPLLILDEATSSLDIESERFIQAALERLMAGRTCLVIAHRLATVQHADCIVVLKEGEIIERGKHQELLALNGEYARLYHLQFTPHSSPEMFIAHA